MLPKIQIEEGQVQGFRALTIANDAMSFTLVPDLGGKISSIFDRRTGHEWLWASTLLPYRRLPYGTSYVEMADTGGWDECFPTVAACAYPAEPWKGSPLPDHGELWSQAWPVEVEELPGSSVTVHGEARGGGVLPYRWQRAVTLAADAPIVRINYRITSLADTPIAFIWSAHPLFVAEPGMSIRIPAGTRMHRWLSFPSDFVPVEEDGQGYEWPVRGTSQGRTIDLSAMPEPSARVAAKLWSEPLSVGDVALISPHGSFHFTFDPALVPQVGLWLNAAGWSGTGGEPYYNLALEPCIGAQDSLEEAVVQFEKYRVLPPRQVKEWWLEVRLEI